MKYHVFLFKIIVSQKNICIYKLDYYSGKKTRLVLSIIQENMIQSIASMLVMRLTRILPTWNNRIE